MTIVSVECSFNSSRHIVAELSSRCRFDILSFIDDSLALGSSCCNLVVFDHSDLSSVCSSCTMINLMLWLVIKASSNKSVSI